MQTTLIVSLIIFVIFFICIERWQSIKTIIRLLLSLLIVYGYMKLLVSGKPIVILSIGFVLLFAAINVLIQNGIQRKSLSELLAVLITSGITSVVIFGIFQKMNLKIYQEEIMRFNGLKNQANILFGISLIISLGIYMDMISKIVFHLDSQRDKTVDTPWKEQFKQGIELGKVYIAEKWNMIVLGLLVILLFPICNAMNKGMKLVNIIEQPEIFAYTFVAIMINIGLILSVLITASMYACFNRKKTIYKTVSENKIDGKRSLKL